MIERIAHFIDYLNIAVSIFEQNISASNGVVRHAIKKNKDIQSKWLVNIADNYPNLSIEWLITGKGEMLKSIEHKIEEPKSNKMLLDEIVKLSEENGRLKAKLEKIHRGYDMAAEE